MDHWFQALDLTGLTTPTMPTAAFGALIIVRTPPAAAEQWGEADWRQWLQAAATCPLCEFNTLAHKWGPPALSVHTYAWIIDADARFEARSSDPGTMDGLFAYVQLDSTAATEWARKAPQPEELTLRLAKVESTATAVAPHYHPFEGFSRYRAAKPISTGSPIKVARPYAFDVRDKRKANVAFGVATSPISKGQPLIAEPPPASKRARLFGPDGPIALTVTDELDVEGAPEASRFKAVVCADNRIRVMVVNPCEGEVTVTVPTGAPANVNAPRPYVFVKGAISTTVVKSKDVGRGSRLWVSKNGSIDD
ncbi:MAG: hypothetical protein CL678_04125, partial [Bdellovibrionaceae bacterium]|nr:hypothetical protein [Pseudobdellovibrionaceae bacterium]